MIDQAVIEIEPLVGTLPACRAIGASRASLYRRRSPPPPRAPTPRRASERALSEGERAAVLAELHSPRFIDASPAEVWATLLDEGTYLASERTMYRILATEHGGVRERRAQLTHPPYAAPVVVVVVWACICGGRSGGARMARLSAICSWRITAVSMGSRARRCC